MDSGLLAIGLDPSPRRLGWGIGRVTTGGATLEPLDCGTFHMEPGPHATTASIKALKRVISGWGGEVSVVVVERPYAGVNPAVFLAIAETCGAVASLMSAAYGPSITIERPTPSGWRASAGLSGRASKEAVMERALQLGFPVKPKDQDAADASLLAWFGRPGR